MANFSVNTIQAHIIRYSPEKVKYEQLILKRSPEARPYPNNWQVVTGRIDNNETALDTAFREIAEETGFESPINAWNLPFVASFYIARKDEIGFSPVFVFEIDSNSEVVLSCEHTEYKWIDISEIDKFVHFPSQVAASEILQKYILDNPENDMYQIKDELWKR
jgi:dihydroneopterin triphosphate diphosphatase